MNRCCGIDSTIPYRRAGEEVFWTVGDSCECERTPANTHLAGQFLIPRNGIKRRPKSIAILVVIVTNNARQLPATGFFAPNHRELSRRIQVLSTIRLL
jgi:hypothetical protein